MTDVQYSTPGVYNPPESKYTVFMEIPKNAPRKIGKLIGPQGRIFKAITHQSRTKYIWCNGQNIEICGDSMDYIQDAIRRIHDRCDYLVEREREREHRDSDFFVVHTEHCLRGAESPRGPLCPACENESISPCPCDDEPVHPCPLLLRYENGGPDAVAEWKAWHEY